MTYQTDIAAATRALRSAQDGLTDEIRAYPTPVDGCDSQYTYLLASRRSVHNALAVLGAEVFVATPRTLTPGSGVESR